MKFAGKTVTAIVEYSKNQILLVKRGTVVFKGYWALPGGKVDSCETAEQAVVREVKEETGLDVAVVAKIGEYHEKGVKDNIEYDYHATCFAVKPIGGAIQRQEREIEEVKLVNVEKVPEPLAFKHSNMIADYKNTKKKR